MKAGKRIQEWIEGKDGRQVVFYCVMTAKGEYIGLIVYAEGTEIVNYVTYSLSDVRFFKKTYARYEIVIPNTYKEKAIHAGLDELGNPEFQAMEARFVIKGGMLIDLILPLGE